jgi:hypothetical protein
VIRTSIITSATGLFGGVGFRNPTDPDYNIVKEPNTTSNSGLYFDDASGFVTIQNIKECQPDKKITVAEFNTYLTNLQKQVIDDVCRQVLADRSKFIYSINLFPYPKAFDRVLEPESGFVGFEIERFDQQDTAAKAEWVELAFDSEVTFNLHLFNSNRKQPIKTLEVTTSANEAKVISLTDWFIADSDECKGGRYYVGYFESDLGGAKPMAKDLEDSNIQICNAFFSIYPVRVDQDNSLLNIREIEYTSDTAGLNLGINIYQDFTALVISHKDLFYPAIQYGMGVKVLNLIKTSIRSNITQRLTSEMIPDIDFELYGNEQLNIAGIKTEYLSRIDSLKTLLFYEPLMTKTTAQ